MYVSQSGRRFVLASHSPAEWGERMKAALLYLGCSEEYAEAVRLEYASARRPDDG